MWGPFHITGDNTRIESRMVPTDAVLANVQGRLSSIRPDSLASVSDLVLKAEFTAVSLASSPHPWGQSGSASVTAVSISKQTSGPTVVPEAELTIDIPVTAIGSRWAPEGGTSPWLNPEHLPKESVLFLSWTGSTWRLRPTAYSAWLVEGDSTYVFVESPYCPGTVYPPARLDLQEFLTSISGE